MVYAAMLGANNNGLNIIGDHAQCDVWVVQSNGVQLRQEHTPHEQVCKGATSNNGLTNLSLIHI
eukprot:1709790-Prorocentrum_lima.AAC.1